MRIVGAVVVQRDKGSYAKQNHSHEQLLSDYHTNDLGTTWATRRAHRSAMQGPGDKQLADEQAALHVRGVHDVAVLAAAVPQLSHLLQRLEAVYRVPTPAERLVSKSVSHRVGPKIQVSPIFCLRIPQLLMASSWPNFCVNPVNFTLN